MHRSKTEMARLYHILFFASLACFVLSCQRSNEYYEINGRSIKSVYGRNEYFESPEVRRVASFAANYLNKHYSHWLKPERVEKLSDGKYKVFFEIGDEKPVIVEVETEPFSAYEINPNTQMRVSRKRSLN